MNQKEPNSTWKALPEPNNTKNVSPDYWYPLPLPQHPLNLKWTKKYQNVSKIPKSAPQTICTYYTSHSTHLIWKWNEPKSIKITKKRSPDYFTHFSTRIYWNETKSTTKYQTVPKKTLWEPNRTKKYQKICHDSFDPYQQLQHPLNEPYSWKIKQAVAFR